MLALLAALIPGALFASVQAYTPPGNKIQFTFEGCRNNGDIVLPIDFGPAGQKYACLDPVYTTGNLGKGWNELDLVPHRLITTNSAGTASTFNVIVAADNVNNGKVGYDVISEPEIFRDSAAGCQVTSGPEAYENGVTGGADVTIYRELTITVPAGGTCQVEWFNRLALGASKYSGSSLQSYMFESDDFKTGKRTVSIPVKGLLPQSISKTMSASQGSSTIWSVKKTATPAVVTIGNTCDAQGSTVDTDVEVKVEWKKESADPSGGVTIKTQVFATNPAARVVTIDVTDRIYAGTDQSNLLDTKSSGPVDVPANTTQLVLEHTYVWATPTPGVTAVNDVATATYTDKATGVAVPGDTQASAEATIQNSGPNDNGTATVTDVEQIDGPGMEFSSDKPETGYVGYTAGTKTTGPVTWVSDEQDDSGDVTFEKTIYVDKGTVGSGALTDTATLLGSNGFTTSADASIAINVDTRPTLTIKKTIPDILTGSETATFTFDVLDSTDQVVADDVEITFTAGQTTNEVDVPNLTPGIYKVVENAPPAGWNPPGQPVEVNLEGATCAGTAPFANDITPATAGAVKITQPPGSEGGWDMTLTRTDSKPPTTTTVATDGDGNANFGQLLEQGTYTITETMQDGWEFLEKSGDCEFTVDYPADSGKEFVCTFTNSKQTALLRLKKQVEGGSASPAEWLLSATADAPFNGKNIVDVPGDNDAYTEVYADELYTLTESEGPANYTPGQFWQCVSDDVSDKALPAVSQDGNQVRLDPGEKVTCTIVNTRDLAELKLVKQVEGASADSWTLTAKAAAPDDDLNISTPGGSGQFESVYAGTQYTLAETGPGGYSPSDWVCLPSDEEPVPQAVEGQLNDGDKITVQAGQRVVCTIVNTRDTGALTIVKEFNPQTSGFTGAFDITYTCVDGGNPVKNGTVSLADGQSQTITDLPTGTTCTVDEPVLPAAPAGWQFNPPSYSPSQQVTVTGKDQTVSVTVVNSIAQVNPEVVKRICPIDVTLKKPLPKKVGNRILTKKIKTNSSCVLVKPVVLCRPITTTAAGETAFCETTITKKGRIKVKTKGYDAVRVRVIVRAKPKPGFEDRWKAKTWRKTWILR
ncbi:MAG: hypothetical protein E6Q90_14505 [Actinobacteria bacterium]|nr:MAG: hypothetical protein E6Q90_14505 [Actinomycetota bacterium]